MLWIDIFFFSAYTLLWAWDEWHLQRGGAARPRWRLLNTVVLAALGGVALAYPPRGFAYLGVLALVGLSAIAFALAELDRGYRAPARERVGATLRAMLHPPMLLLLVTTWQFIDGAGFFLGLVLPLSMKNLRPFCIGYLAVCSCLLLWQLVALIRGSSAPVGTAAPEREEIAA